MDIKQLIKLFEIKAEELENNSAFYGNGSIEDNVFLNIASDLEFHFRSLYSPHDAIDKVLERLESGLGYERQQEEWPEFCNDAKNILLKCKAP